jgi:predicted nucleotidyltransferase
VKVGGHLPIPSLSQSGLLPPGDHECSLAEVGAAFVYNERRQNLWRQLLSYLGELRPFDRITAIYLDGSFVTDKAEPSDIDLVVKFDSIIAWVLLQTERPKLFAAKAIRRQYELDVYPHADNLREGETDIIEVFRQLRIEEAQSRKLPPGTTKGILIIKPTFEL